MPQITRSARRWAALSLCLMSFAATHASASVTLLGNRVIYPAEAREKRCSSPMTTAPRR